jgi:hypothetical protein
MSRVSMVLIPTVLTALTVLSSQAPASASQPYDLYLSTRQVERHVISAHRAAHSSKTAPSTYAPKTAFAVHSTKTAPTVPMPHVGVPSGMDASANWAGYVVTPSSNSPTYTSITGSWVVPPIFGSPASMGSQWIGLGGVNSSDLLQMGTIEQLEGRREVAMLFWEKLPSPANLVMTIPVGSKVSAAISTQNGSDWSLDFDVVEPGGKVASKHITVTLDKAYAAGIGTSAEWISEDPAEGNGSLYPLANTGVVTFTDATVNGRPISASGNQVHPTALVDAWGRVRIVPTALYASGSSFSTIDIGYPVGMVWSRYGWWAARFGTVHHGWY